MLKQIGKQPPLKLKSAPLDCDLKMSSCSPIFKTVIKVSSCICIARDGSHGRKRVYLTAAGTDLLTAKDASLVNMVNRIGNDGCDRKREGD